MSKAWMDSWIWGVRPITGAFFTVVLVVAVGPWGLLAAWPLAIILAEGILRLLRDRHQPVDIEKGRIREEMWEVNSAEAGHDPHLDDITASLIVRRPRRLRPPSSSARSDRRS